MNVLWHYDEFTAPKSIFLNLYIDIQLGRLASPLSLSLASYFQNCEYLLNQSRLLTTAALMHKTHKSIETRSFWYFRFFFTHYISTSI